LIHSGVEVDYLERHGLIHVFPLLPVPEAAQIFEELAATILT